MKRRIKDGSSFLLALASGLLLLCPNVVAKDAANDKATVSIDSFQFQPKKITIKKGGVVTFTNHDAAPHTVSPAKDAKFVGTGRLLKDETKTVQFNEVGTQKYLCDFHPSMQGTIVVVDQ